MQRHNNHHPTAAAAASASDGVARSRGYSTAPTKRPMEEPSNAIARQATGNVIPDSTLAIVQANPLIEDMAWLEMCHILLTADGEPPITRASLSELDLQRIINDPKLRHDLNYERDVAFRPNYDGPRGEKKRDSAKLYWQALAVEFYYYFKRSTYASRPVSENDLLCRMEEIPADSDCWRLPRMFEAIREILKTLVPSIQCSAVDQAMDVSLLMQQLRKGVCDLIGLSNWLGTLLTGSCSPVRDPFVMKMVSSIHEAVRQSNPKKLASAIEDLFSILEIMKLDVANHQIRHLRSLMIQDSIQYEQRFFFGQITNCDANLAESRRWYNSRVMEDYAREGDRRGGHLILASAMVALVVSNKTSFPATFEFDTERLRMMQADARVCISQAVISETFTSFLLHLGYRNKGIVSAQQEVLQRIAKMDPQPGPDGRSYLLSEQIALEIVRAAYHICHRRSLPTDKDVSDIDIALQTAWEAAHNPDHRIMLDIRARLDKIVSREMKDIESMSPLQLMDHYDSTKPENDKCLHTQSELQAIGQRIAHLAIMHWRVWGPILYEEPASTLQSESSAAAQGAAAEDAPRELSIRSGRTESGKCRLKNKTVGLAGYSEEGV